MSMLTQTVVGTLASSKSSHMVFERYTEDTRRAIFFARQECQRRCSSVITAGDLLCGLGVDEDTRAARIGELKANAFYLRWLLGLPALPVRVEEAYAAMNVHHFEFDPEVKRALGFAVMESDRDHEYWIDSDHLLRGLFRFQNKAHFAVLKTEINLNTARSASHEDREKHPAEVTPNLKAAKYNLRKYAGLLIPPMLGLACYLYIVMQNISLR